MENIIILILFTYPGIMTDFLHGMMIKGKQYDQQPEEYYRVARDFFLSAVISAATMLPFCSYMGIPYSLVKTKEAVGTGKGLCFFILFSLLFCIITAAGWAISNRIVLKIWNYYRSKRGKPTLDVHKEVWKSVFTDEYINYNDCAMAVYQNGKLIKAGLPLNVSNDYENDPWAILTWTETTKAELEKEVDERTLLIDPIASVVNIENGITIDIYDGKRLRDYITSWCRSQAEVEISQG